MSIFDPRTGDVRPARVWGYVVGAFIAICVISWGSWYFTVATSGVKGKGDVIKKNNDANNQIEAQHTFDALWGDITGYKTKIANASTALKANPGDPVYEQTLTGLENACVDAVKTYNGDANDTTMKDWRPASLPAQIISADYCEVAP
jgi:hypothetical protein